MLTQSSSSGNSETKPSAKRRLDLPIDQKLENTMHDLIKYRGASGDPLVRGVHAEREEAMQKRRARELRDYLLLDALKKPRHPDDDGRLRKLDILDHRLRPAPEIDRSAAQERRVIPRCPLENMGQGKE